MARAVMGCWVALGFVSAVSCGTDREYNGQPTAGGGGPTTSGAAGKGGSSTDEAGQPGDGSGNGGQGGSTVVGTGGDGGANQGECTPDSTRCKDALSMETCAADGSWHEAVSCGEQACVGGACDGDCSPGGTRCSADGNGVEACSEAGTWAAASKCEYPKQSCSNGECIINPSCDSLLNNCGAAGNETCCANSLVPGGEFFRSWDGIDYTDKSYPATVAAFRLDKFEVTVGRFRGFVKAYVAGFRPANESGKHTHLYEGAGLKAGAGNETGWSSEWTETLPTTLDEWTESVTKYPDLATWASSAGANDNLPINQMTWRQAYAFCIWDGGFLPSEAEWNYAAAGGDHQRTYPWPASVPDISSDQAVYYDGASHFFAPVGSKPQGNGRWGHADLTGNVAELTMDQGNAIAASGGMPTVPYAKPCINCMTTSADGNRNQRGGHKSASISEIPMLKRYSQGELHTQVYGGFRCAYEP